MKRPWCYVGTGDADWDYCDDSCAQEDSPPGPAGRCSVTITGKACDAWGENDFGLDPASATCEQVDGLDRPWCYTSEEDWDYCNCNNEGTGTGTGSAAKSKNGETVKRDIEPGCEADRAETKALRTQIAELKENKRATEMRSELVDLSQFCCTRTSFVVRSLISASSACEVVELRQKLSALGHEW